MDMSFQELNNRSASSWEQKYQLLTNDTTKDKHTGRYRLGLNSLFILDKNPF